MKLYKGKTKKNIGSEFEVVDTGKISTLGISEKVIPYKDDAILIKMPNKKYVDLSDVKSKFDLLKLYHSANQIDDVMLMLFEDERLMGNTSWCPDGKCFVDEESLTKLSRKESIKTLCRL